MRSIRARLLLGTVLSAVLVLSITGLALYWRVRASLMAEFDAALRDKARTLAAMAEIEDGHIELDIKDLDMPEFRRVDRPEYLQVWGPAGEVMVRSPSLGGANLERFGGSLESPVSRPTLLPYGVAGRIIGVTFQPRPGREDEGARLPPSLGSPWMTLVLARPTGEVDAVLARLGFLLIALGGLAVVATSVVLARVVHGGLRPLRDLAARIGQLSEEELSARIELPDAPAELVPIAERLNDLLTRLEASFGREKAFTADVAHELRTPLAGLRSTLEVSLSKSREACAYQVVLQDSLAITCQMQTMVQNLLCLARMEAGQAEIVREPTDVPMLLRECWKPLAQGAAERGLHVKWDLQDPCVLETDDRKLRQVLRNLLDNAVAYTNPSGSIEMRAWAADSQVRIEIANTGCRLAPEEAEKVFDRFWRGDAARQDTGVHCGLGLSLARRILILLGGDIQVECTAEGVFCVRLSMAAAAPQAQAMAARRPGHHLIRCQWPAASSTSQGRNRAL